jgi:hypothetical protein
VISSLFSISALSLINSHSKQKTRSEGQTSEASPLSKCIQRAAQITQNLNQLHAGESLVKFFDGLVFNYTSGQDINATAVNNFMNELNHLHTSATQVESDIIQIAGIGAESNGVITLVANLRTLMHCAEEILCEVLLEDKAALLSAHTAQKLMYQGL